MFASLWLSSLKRQLRPRFSRSARAQRNRHQRHQLPSARALVSRHAAETLEDRTLLTAFTVVNANDSGAGSLRNAIERANTNAGADTISFNAALAGQTIVLNTELHIRDDLTIISLGADQLTLDGNHNSRIFKIDNLNSFSQINVEITGLTLKNGNSVETGPTPNGNGGAIVSFENLTLRDCVITSNNARLGGGAIYSRYGSLNIENTLITENTSDLHGGGGISFYQVGGTGLSISDSTISFNSTTHGGGGILVTGGAAFIRNSSIIGNSCSDNGAGVNLNGSSSTIVESSTFSQNHAGYNGGAFHSGGELFISNSTISGNSALNVGAGIYSFTTASLDVTNSTIVLNYGRSSLSQGAAVYGSNSLPFTIANCIVAENTAASQSQITGLYNDISNIITDSIIGLIDPLLGDHGGPVKTHALLAGSPAIDAGSNALATQKGLTTDQRGTGFDRIAGGTVDIGAFEVQIHDLVVDTLSDLDDGDYSAGELSLREAIKLANLNSGADTISFDASLSGQTIVVSDELVISDHLTLVGLGADQLTLDGNHDSRLFYIDNANLETRISVEIEGLKLMNGYAVNTDTPPSGLGGAILSYEDLVLKNIIIAGNTAERSGGGVHSSHASLTVENSLFLDNSASLSGGGIYFTPSAGFRLSIDESTFGMNSSELYGGAIYLESGFGSIQNSTFTENTAESGGGAIVNGVLAEMTVSSSTFYLNTTNENGGALYNSGDLHLYNSTLSENSAVELGGGIYSFTTAPLEIVNSTIVANQATSMISRGGGIYGSTSDAAVIANSIIAGNTAANESQILGLYTDSFNIVTDEITGLIDPVLRDNGGGTKNHALLPDSSAIDAGSNAAAVSAGLLTDQRGPGYARILSGAVDIGAVEKQPLSFVVDTTSDVDDGDYSSGNFSLREAIRLANDSRITDFILFDAALVGQTIFLESELTITDHLTITGWGANLLTLDANHNSRIFFVDDGDLNTMISVEIDGITLKNGYTQTIGGGILSVEDLSIRNSILTGNHARQGGGGIYTSDASLTVENSLLSNNSSTFQGGGGLMYFHTGGTGLTINESTFSQNTSEGDGGAIYLFEGDATIQNSTFTTNQSVGLGGAVQNGYLGTMIVSSSTFNENHAEDRGGALSNLNELYLRNSTLSENSSSYIGGGIYTYRYNTLEIVNSTIVLNQATTAGGGIYVVSPVTMVEFSNTIIAGNKAGSGLQVYGGFLGEANIISDSITGLLDPVLRNNGGMTRTHALLPESLAIDAGNNTVTTESGLNTDQRGTGFARIINGTVDIGAFEVQAPFAQIDLRIVDSQTTVSSNGEVASLPENLGWLEEWQGYWLEIWLSTPSTSELGILSAALELTYNTAITTATGIEYGAAFSLNQTGAINDLTGTIENLSAETSLTDAGDDQHVLFARIRFESTTDDGIDLDLEGKRLNPQSPAFVVNYPEIQFTGGVSEEIHGPAPATQIWANPFDLNDDDAINFRDLVQFITVYGTKPSESNSDFSWFADFNQNDRVDFRDLISFINNYEKSKANQSTVNYPQNYRDAWNQLLTVDSLSKLQPNAKTVTQSAAERVLESVVEQVSPQLTPSQTAALEQVDIKVVDLAGDTLGRAVPGTIYIDVNAAGRGWFVDASPADHSEFTFDSELTLIALPESAAANGVDLWTVIVHELGHLLGYEHEESGLMQETLASGVRFLPGWFEGTDAFFSSLDEETEILSF